MSTAVVPQFKLHHRLRLALEVADVAPEQMAADLGVHINSIHNYMSGRREPKLGMIKQWALRTGVSFLWIIDGEQPEEGGEQVVGTSGCTVSQLFQNVERLAS